MFGEPGNNLAKANCLWSFMLKRARPVRWAGVPGCLGPGGAGGDARAASAALQGGGFTFAAKLRRVEGVVVAAEGE